MTAPKTIVDVATLAGLLDLTAVRVQQLAADGVVVKAGRGKYELWPSIKGYIAFLQSRKLNQYDAGGPGVQDLRAQLLTAQIVEQETKNAVRRGELVEAAGVLREWQALIAACRAKLLSLGDKLAARLPIPDNTRKKVAALIREGIAEALKELAHDRA